jgi:type IV fimbrial biogenesis protein FimT
MKFTCGFTLIELMVALGVAAILLLVGVPSFQEFIKSNMLSSRVNNFVADLNFTRGEAINRSGRVTMCRSVNLTSCDRTFGVGWEKGWIIFSDQGTAGRVDSGDTILRKNGAVSDSTTIRGNWFVRRRISFQSSGIVEPNNGTVVFCDDRVRNYSADKTKVRAVVISTTGRIRTTKGSDPSLSEIESCTPFYDDDDD